MLALFMHSANTLASNLFSHSNDQYSRTDTVCVYWRNEAIKQQVLALHHAEEAKRQQKLAEASAFEALRQQKQAEELARIAGELRSKLSGCQIKTAELEKMIEEMSKNE
jgi:hypothetical protein